MRARLSLVSLGVLAFATLFAPAASAAITVPLSNLAALPKAAPLRMPEATTTVPGLKVTSKDGYASTKWYELETATGRGYCFARTEGSSRWLSTWGSSATGEAEDLDLDRLVEKDGKVTLERTVVRFDPKAGTAEATGRSHVALVELARNPNGVVVWGYRDGTTIVVLARSADRGQDSRKLTEDGGFPFMSSEGCPYAGARLDGRKPDTGAVAQLAGTLPPVGTGKDKVSARFVVDASLSKVSRDPEAMIAIRLRMTE